MTLSAVGPSYDARASVLLFPPTSNGDDLEGQTRSGNPYLELGGLNTARDIVIRTLTSQSARDTLEASHPNADYALAPDATSSGPIVNVEVSASSAQEALAALRDLVDEFPPALSELQTGIGLSPAESITARILTIDGRAKTVHKSQVRAGIVSVAGVIVLALALIALIDGLLAYRRESSLRDVDGTVVDEPPGHSGFS
jgi:predicted secreted protein